MTYAPAFSLAVARVLKHEGGYKPATPDDPGGETNRGICKRDYPNEDIRNMTDERATAIYLTDYWLPSHLSQLPAALTEVAARVFDIGVDTGMKAAIICLQRALRAVTGRALTEDGGIGAETVQAASSAAPEPLLTALRSELAAHYRLVAVAKPAEAPNLGGWLNRAYAP
jgi:lysozyme family protein